MRLKDKIALVTGGARGIGFATASAFFKEGATVVIADINQQGAEEAAKRLDPHLKHVKALEVNVADPLSITAMMDAILADYGRLDLLLNNAGVGGNGQKRGWQNRQYRLFVRTTRRQWTLGLWGCQSRT